MRKLLLVLLLLSYPAFPQVTFKGVELGGKPQVATPTDSPGQGTYSVTQSVTFSDATSGATICYTNDGSTPTAPVAGTCSGGTTQTYSGAISTASTTTYKVIGTKVGFINSGVLTTTYTITAGFNQIFNFRATAGFVPDGANQNAVTLGSNSYPATINGQTVGWTTLIDGTADRNASNIPQLAGIAYRTNNNGPGIFRWDLAAATYTFCIAAGDAGFANSQKVVLKDGGVAFMTAGSPTATTAQQFIDTAGNIWTNATWSANQVCQSHALTGTLTMEIGANNGDSTTATTIASLQAHQ